MIYGTWTDDTSVSHVILLVLPHKTSMSFLRVSGFGSFRIDIEICILRLKLIVLV